MKLSNFGMTKRIILLVLSKKLHLAKGYHKKDDPIRRVVDLNLTCIIQQKFDDQPNPILYTVVLTMSIYLPSIHIRR